MTEYFMSTRIIDGKPREVIVDENGKVVNRDPTKEELKGLKTEHNKVKRQKYTRHQLSEFLRKFKREEERVLDFNNNPKYPSFSVYIREFGTLEQCLNNGGFTE